MRSTMSAPLLPSATSRSMRLRSTATNANSAATKKPVARMSSRTATRPSAVAMCAGYSASAILWCSGGPVTKTKTKVAVGAGAVTMVALCFANGLQQGIDQSQSQAIESLKASFHVSDLQIGLIRVATGSAGALGALLIARLCRDRARTVVLSGMFVAWSLLMLLTGFVGLFPLFVVMRALAAPTEATDPAALPLLADWWPAEQRAAKVSIFQAGAAVGAIVGI